MLAIRVLLVDDNKRFLDSASQFLAQTWLTIVGRALSGHEAVAQAARLRPDLVLMDIAMPGMNGLEATSRIKAQPNPPRVIILTLHDMSVHVAEVQASGADHVVSKTAMGLELLPAIERLFPGRDTAVIVPSSQMT
jgi:two-component system invasion response regulator UvrY